MALIILDFDSISAKYGFVVELRNLVQMSPHQLSKVILNELLRRAQVHLNKISGSITSLVRNVINYEGQRP